MVDKDNGSFSLEVSKLPYALLQNCFHNTSVVVKRDSLLKGTEGLLCRPDPLLREACCPPGALVKDGSESFSPDTALRLLSITDFQVCSKEVPTSLRATNRLQGLGTTG